MVVAAVYSGGATAVHIWGHAAGCGGSGGGGGGSGDGGGGAISSEYSAAAANEFQLITGTF